jgi:diacylglycerol kinase (ATP)
MKKAALLYNPDSGGSRGRRQAELAPVLSLLHNSGVEVELILTHSSAHAEDQARLAVSQGCDAIFACGGDGTIHNVIQVLAKSKAALAILPMGTANALAHDLKIPFNLLDAAGAALNSTPRRLALGHISYLDFERRVGERYFVVAAGVGVDAHLFYKLHTATKKRMGMAAYYAKAWNLWFTYSMNRFLVEYSETGSTPQKQANVTELMGVRIRNFGGVLQELAPGASLDRDDMRLVFCRTASRMSYLLYVTRGLLRQKWKVPGVDLAFSKQASCRYLSPMDDPSSSAKNNVNPAKIYVEADGELLGTLPAELTVIPDAITILAPSR